MKYLYLAVTVFALCGGPLAGQAVAGDADKAQAPSSVPYEPQEYSPPLGGESCSTPTPIS